MSGHGQYNLSSSDGTTEQAALQQMINVKGAVYQYMIADGSIAAYSACSVQNDGDAEELTTTTSGSKPTLVCLAQFAVADNEYFWGAVGPFFLREDRSTTFKVNAALNCATSVLLYTTATDGVVDDTSAGSTDLIRGLFLTESITTAEAADCMAACSMGTNLA